MLLVTHSKLLSPVAVTSSMSPLFTNFPTVSPSRSCSHTLSIKYQSRHVISAHERYIDIPLIRLICAYAMMLRTVAHTDLALTWHVSPSTSIQIACLLVYVCYDFNEGTYTRCGTLYLPSMNPGSEARASSEQGWEAGIIATVLDDASGAAMDKDLIQWSHISVGNGFRQA